MSQAARNHVSLECKEVSALPKDIADKIDAFMVASKAANDKNDQRLDNLAKKFDDVVTKDEQKKIDAAMDELKSAVNAEIAALKRAAKSSNSGDTSDIEAKLDRLRRLEAKAFDAFIRRPQNQGVNDMARVHALATSEEYKDVTEHYAREYDIEAKDLSTIVAEEGGYLVLPEYEREMEEILLETSPVRQVANVRQIGSRELIIPVNRKGTTVAWIGEKGTRSETATPIVSQEHFVAHELYAYPEVTKAMLEDAQFDVEAWLAEEVTEAIMIEENTRFVLGDGNGKPRGFLHSSITKTAAASYDANTHWGTLSYRGTGVSGGFAAAPNGADVLIDTVYDVKPAHRNGGADWLMTRRTMAGVRKLKDSNGDYLIRDAITESGLVPVLLGFPVHEAEDMPEIAADTYSIAFGNWNKGYQIVDRIGVQVIRDEITKPGFVKYHFRKRTGGDVKNYDAIKLIKFA